MLPKPYYETELGTLYCGNCIDVMADLSSVDLVITSPPYNMGISSGGGISGAGKKGLWVNANNGGLGEGYDTHTDKMSWLDYEKWQKNVLLASWNILSNDGAIFYNHKPRCQNGVVRLPLIYNPGLPLRQIITWVRPNGFNFSISHYLPSYEWVLLFAKPQFKLKSKGSSGISDVWRMTPESGSDHPCPFPESLPSNVLNTTNGDPVLDPFMGSGTTAIACEQLNRRWIGIEISEKYCEMAAKRIEKEREQLKLFEPQPRPAKHKQESMF